MNNLACFSHLHLRSQSISCMSLLFMIQSRITTNLSLQFLIVIIVSINCDNDIVYKYHVTVTHIAVTIFVRKCNTFVVLHAVVTL